jgi:hypothetical protein
MTVIKQYNTTSGQWEAILVGATGPTGPAGPATNVLTLNEGDPIPVGTPAGTLILVVPV